MAVEVANYIYIFGPLCWGLMAAFGALFVTLSKNYLRLARKFFLFSVIPLLAVPIAFGCTANSTVIGLSVAALSTFILAMVYYVGISILNEHLERADQAPKRRGS